MFEDGFGSRTCSVALCWLVVQLASVGTSAAVPVDFADPTPREVAVQFEVSPREHPQQIADTYTTWLSAYLMPGVRPGEARVIVAGELVEKHLMDQENPVVGSFTDFVWTFDSETGQVLSARFNGTVVRRLSWGFMTTRALADIEVEMSTRENAGFHSPVKLLGQLFFRHCNPGDGGCTVVESRPYDFNTGYVNAVGMVRVKSAVMELRGFSPLGEAIFQEVDRPAHDGIRFDRDRPERDVQLSIHSEAGHPHGVPASPPSGHLDPHEIN